MHLVNGLNRGRDSAIGASPIGESGTPGPKPNGKSSPSSSSVTSKDSGCSEQSNHHQQQQIQNATVRPLSTLIERQESNQSVINNGFVVRGGSEESTESALDIIDCDDEAEETTEESSSTNKNFSPPRTNEAHPGFSSKGRRSLFRAAINELEDTFNMIKSDVDLLDRAERRDLPTAHQELRLHNLERDDTTTSLNTSGEMLFSDMDNFMNWNTSSSFENIPDMPNQKRQRTPSNRRSGVIDKTKDDVVYRLCRDNNKPVSTSGCDPGVKANQSYLLLSPAMTPATSTASVNSEAVKIKSFGRPEPDVHWDDKNFRSMRDALGKIPEKEPKFGIPKEKIVTGSSNKDYLHAIPEADRYRPTFNARKHPDTVKDDMAFRALRKDGNLADPNHLGIVRDPNAPIPDSCWRHKMEVSR